ncbi:hypothetical protein HK103_003996 [Boothiomyces macroporosus]|uniref:arginine--tRNA ligase n=1 Tax=Boothiomyces macroporosus TaxID=261099 RepID=A0AAD5UHC0_9FUNG|nr:hypothetical protein HK103_003996 [Boothiomyces macroporosus]
MSKQLPLPVQQHRNTLFLSFSPKCIPYAEIAAFHLSKTQANLKLGIQSNLLSTQPQLIIPKGKFSNQKITLTGKSSILRYFARLGGDLYPSSTKERLAIDDWLDSARNHDKVLQKLSKNSSKYLVGPKLSIADLVCWDFTLQSNVTTEWSNEKSTIPELKKAQELAATTLESIPVVETYKFKLIEQLITITGCDVDTLYGSFIKTKAKTHGDIAISLYQLKAGNPAELAKKIVDQFKLNEYVTKVTAAGAFANFTFNHLPLYYGTIKQAIRLGKKYGTNTLGLGKFGIVEYSSPNIAKVFHVGHLRSTIIGSFLHKILDANGWSTLSINYLGDWGKQFGILAIGFQKHGSEELLKKDAIKHLFDVYVKINQDMDEDPTIDDQAKAYFKRMENGDKDALVLWQRFRDLSIAGYEKTYNRLNIKFDLYSGESQYSLSQMRVVLDELNSKGLLKPDNGALVIDLKEHGHGTAVIGKTDGSMLYLSRDIAAADYRHKTYDFEKLFYVVASQQDHHFKQLFKILELMGKTWTDKCTHISFGMIKSKNGTLSTRKGNVVFLADILDQVQEEMHNVMKKNEAKYAQIEDPERVSDIIGMSAVKIQDMAARRIKDYDFDIDRMTSFEGDTGPYLQYAHARLSSIQRKRDDISVTLENLDDIKLDLLTEPSALAVIELVQEYPNVIRELGQTYEPCNLVTYALRLSHAVSSAYNDLWVVGQPEDLAYARLALYGAARTALGNALTLLGLEPLERM